LGLSPAPTGPVALLYDDLFLAHDSWGHPESAARLTAITSRLRGEPQLGPECWGTALPAEDEHLLLVHRPRHLERIRELCRRGGGWIDSDTYCVASSYRVALGAVGASLEAVRLALTCPARPAFALVRPPGHHATPERAMGFCLFNNAAIAVRQAQRAHGLERVAVVDLDVHHGNGTQEVFYDDGDVLYCSLHQFPLYPGSGRAEERGEGRGSGTTVNVPLPPGTGPEPWLAALREQVLPALRRHRPQLILVSAGFDALGTDPLAQLALDPAAYGSAAAVLADVAAELGAAPMVWLLEGGYDLEQMPEAVRLCALSLAGAPSSPSSPATSLGT
jgi:acetoin utilization deacetylase AcuC-like enzyme